MTARRPPPLLPLSRRALLSGAGRLALGGALGVSGPVLSAAALDPDPADWPTVLKLAEGQTVYFNAWGGSESANAYIAWAGGQVQTRFGISLTHVKLTDTAEAVARVLAEKTAGKREGGSVDLVWINGENFAAMKSQGLLFGPFAEALPNFRFVDTEDKPTVRLDFTIPTDGLESPWGMAQLTFYFDSARLPEPPRSLTALSDWAATRPGRFAYPAPPDFLGSTFLKQALIDLGPDPAALQAPVDGARFATVTAPLWAWLEELHPHLWRQGRLFPQNGAALTRLMSDGETDIAFSFNPSEASAAMRQGLLPETVRSFVLAGGTIANTHFLAIPFNAGAKAGAMVVADFLLSPEAQLRKEDERVWGDPTVLAMAKLDPALRQAFADLPRGPATLAPDRMGKALPEPHPSWMTALEAQWRRRFAT
jgi:putative thiamine transport system substrate-binding protein